MTDSRLKLHLPGTESSQTENTGSRVSMPLSEILPPLADAMVNNRQWLYDLADEPISISEDLAEILRSIQQLQAKDAKRAA